jgi:hypothetical protein
LWRNVIVAELAKNPDLEPLDLLLGLMRMPQLPLALRIDAARQGLPYCQVKPRAQPPPSSQVDTTEPRVKVRPIKGAGLGGEDIELDDDFLGLGRNGGADAAFDMQDWLEAAARAAGLPAEDHDRAEGPATVDVSDTEDTADASSDGLARASDARPAKSTTAAAKTKQIGPMAFLRALMRHRNTPLHLRLEVAGILAPYRHAKPLAALPSQEAFEVEDEFGFNVDLVLAKRLWELKRALDFALPHPAAASARNADEQAAMLWAKLAEEKKALRCPDGYGWEAREKDNRRLAELSEKRKAGTLTPQENAEEIHLTARVLSYDNGEEHARNSEEHARRELARKPLSELYAKWKNYEIDEIDQEVFDYLRSRLDYAVIDPVAEDFYRQLCTEAWFRRQPEPTREEADKLLAAKDSSADIVREPVGPQGPAEVDFAAWLRGKVRYQPWLLRKAAHQRFGTFINTPIVPELIVLVRSHNIVPEGELSPYFAWILRLYDEATKDGKPLPQGHPRPPRKADRGL